MARSIRQLVLSASKIDGIAEYIQYITCVEKFDHGSKRPLFHLSVSVSVFADLYPDKKWKMLNNVGAMLVVRVSIRIVLSVNSVRIKWFSARPLSPCVIIYIERNRTYCRSNLSSLTPSEHKILLK